VNADAEGGRDLLVACTRKERLDGLPNARGHIDRFQNLAVRIRDGLPRHPGRIGLSDMCSDEQSSNHPLGVSRSTKLENARPAGDDASYVSAAAPRPASSATRAAFATRPSQPWSGPVTS
jgi:hypothetical protein